MTSSVTAPLERQFGQMPGLKQMSSTSSGGASVITLQFDLALPLDVAEQEVQAAINAGSNLLPHGPAGAADLQQGQPGRRADPHARRSPRARCRCRRSQNLADTRLAQKLSQVPGVGLVTLSRRAAARGAHPGEPEGARRRTASALEDVRTAIANANVNQAKGSFDGPTPRLHHRRQRPARVRRRIPAR